MGLDGTEIISLEKSCITCAGNGSITSQLPQLMKMFKVACLSYKPSPVAFDNKMFERNQLIEAQGYLLLLAIQQLRHLDFNLVEKQLLGATEAWPAFGQEATDSLHNSPNTSKLISNVHNYSIQNYHPSVESYDSIGIPSSAPPGDPA